MVIVGVPCADGAVVGAAGLFGRGAHRVVPESSMHAARSIASWLGPDGALGPDGPPGPPLLWRELVPGSVLGCCCAPEMIRESPSLAPHRPTRDAAVVQVPMRAASVATEPSIRSSPMLVTVTLVNMSSRQPWIRWRCAVRLPPRGIQHAARSFPPCPAASHPLPTRRSVRHSRRPCKRCRSS